MDVVRDVIGEVGAAHVAGIPLSTELGKDLLIWNAEKHGDFSVKTAYHHLSASRRNNRPGSSSSDLDPLWKPLWKAPIPNKIKEFIWRLAKDILPTRSNVCSKGITIDPSCPFCDSCPETSAHLFVHCSFIKRMLFAGTLGVRIPSVRDACEWLLQVFKSKDLNMVQFVCFGLWKVWQARNSVVFRNANPCPLLLANEVCCSVSEFNASSNAATLSSLHAQLEGNGGNCWSIQTDAGCFEGGVVVLGCVIKAPNGDVLMVATQRMSCFASPSIVEAFGIKWGLQLAKNAQIDNVTVQYDALGVVDCVNGVSYAVDLEPIVLDCQFLIKSFVSVAVLFVGRNNISDAHNLVSLGRVVGSRTWLGCIPLLEENSVSLAPLAYP
ncbi:uncharacterized protein LOC131650453 [Vicia villosa]|uniref:uncharacterized protein LOC131650453 n=1 Tax=Vicia villosa TaxID=3911 RepID=UPI00273B95A3|nr:uncharacterized protein LOC131650453 [Vicia villosa]